MSTFAVHESKTQLRNEDIVRVEQQLGASLPADYRRFLLTHNGGRPEPNAFPAVTHPGGDFEILAWFLCVQEGHVNDLLRTRNILRGRIPENLLPVAQDPFGNLICISLYGPDRGKTYFWDHEQEVPEGETPDYRNVHPVAETFDALVNSLQSLP